MIPIFFLLIFPQSIFSLEFQNQHIALENRLNLGTPKARHKRAYTRWTSDVGEKPTTKFLVQIFDESVAPPPVARLLVRDTQQHDRMQRKLELKNWPTKLHEIQTKKLMRVEETAGLAQYTRFKPHGQKKGTDVDLSEFTTENRFHLAPLRAGMELSEKERGTLKEDAKKIDRSWNMRDSVDTGASRSTNRTGREQTQIGHLVKIDDSESSDSSEDLSDGDPDSDTESSVDEFENVPVRQLHPLVGQGSVHRKNNLKNKCKINKCEKNKVTSIFYTTELMLTKNLHGFNMYIDIEEKSDSENEYNNEIQPDKKSVYIDKKIQIDLEDKGKKENKKLKNINEEKKQIFKIDKIIKIDLAKKEGETWNKIKNGDSSNNENEYIEIEPDKVQFTIKKTTPIDLKDKDKKDIKKIKKTNDYEKQKLKAGNTFQFNLAEKEKKDNKPDSGNAYIEIEPDKKLYKIYQISQVDSDDKEEKEIKKVNKSKERKLNLDRKVKFGLNDKEKKENNNWNIVNKGNSGNEELKLFSDDDDSDSGTNEIYLVKYNESFKIFTKTSTKFMKKTTVFHKKNSGDATEKIKFVVNLPKKHLTTSIHADDTKSSTRHGEPAGNISSTCTIKRPTNDVCTSHDTKLSTHKGTTEITSEETQVVTQRIVDGKETHGYQTETPHETIVTPNASTKTTKTTTINTIATEENTGAYFKHSCNDDSKKGTFDFFTAHCTADIIAQIDAWVAKYSIAKRVDIVSGSAMLLGNPVVMVIVDDRREGQSSLDKSIVLIVAGISGRDHHAVAAAMYVLYELIEKTDANMALFREFRFWIIPVFNPDGYDYSLKYHKSRNWIKNLRHTWEQTELCEKRGIGCILEKCKGVNLDRNFEYQWIYGSCLLNPHYPDRCNDLFPGIRHLSEPETWNLTTYLEHLEVLPKFFIAFKEGHLLGIMYPYAHTKNLRQFDPSHRRRAARAALRIKSIAGRNYVAGQTSEFLPLHAGGIEDWMEGHLGVSNSYSVMLNHIDFADNITLEHVCHEGYVAVETLLQSGSTLSRSRTRDESNSAQMPLPFYWRKRRGLPDPSLAAIQLIICLLFHPIFIVNSVPILNLF